MARNKCPGRATGVTAPGQADEDACGLRPTGGRAARLGGVGERKLIEFRWSLAQLNFANCSIVSAPAAMRPKRSATGRFAATFQLPLICGPDEGDVQSGERRRADEFLGAN